MALRKTNHVAGGVTAIALARKGDELKFDKDEGAGNASQVAVWAAAKHLMQGNLTDARFRYLAPNGDTYWRLEDGAVMVVKPSEIHLQLSYV